MENVVPISLQVVEGIDFAGKGKQHSLYPIKFFEDVFRVGRVRALFQSESLLSDSFVKFFLSINNALLNISLNKVGSSPGKLYFALNWLNCMIEITKYQSLQDLLSVSGHGSYNRETTLQSIFTLVFVSCKHDQPGPDLKTALQRCLLNCCKLLEAEPGETEQVEDAEYFLKLFFKLHFDEDAQFVQAANLELCIGLCRLIKGVIIHSVHGVKIILKKYKLEFNSVIGRYNKLLSTVVKIPAYEVACNQSLNTLLSILKL